MNDHELDAALNRLSVEPSAGFPETVMANLAELDALRELADRQARGRRVLWLAAGAGGLVAACWAALAVLVPPAWLVQTGQSAILALAAVHCERWGPAALLAAAVGVVLSGTAWTTWRPSSAPTR